MTSSCAILRWGPEGARCQSTWPSHGGPEGARWASRHEHPLATSLGVASGPWAGPTWGEVFLIRRPCSWFWSIFAQKTAILDSKPRVSLEFLGISVIF